MAAVSRLTHLTQPSSFERPLSLLARPADVEYRPTLLAWVGGFFIIATSSREDAEGIAKTCPHLRYGGRIVVNAILPT